MRNVIYISPTVLPDGVGVSLVIGQQVFQFYPPKGMDPAKESDRLVKAMRGIGTDATSSIREGGAK